VSRNHFCDFLADPDRRSFSRFYTTNIGRSRYSEILHAGAAPDTYNTYCHTEGAVGHPLRHEPCVPHPGTGHETPYMYIGDWNAANQTDEYVVSAATAASSEGAAAVGAAQGVEYTPLFSAKGFRYAALSLHPPSTPVRTLSGPRTEPEPRPAASRSSSHVGFAWRPSLRVRNANFCAVYI
jgi:hypothetical protein